MKAISSNRLWIIGAVTVGIAMMLTLFDPTSCRLYPRCLLHEWTGMYCPGCGTTRALTQLLHGHWLAAMRLNAVMVIGLPLLGVLYATGRLDRIRPVWIWTLLAFLVVFGVLRNLPWTPFTWLAPQP